MSASNKSWLMIGGLALLVAGIIYATKALNGKPAPPAEISPTTLISETTPAAQSRTQFPTILRAKPVTETEVSASPRYAPRDATAPTNDRRVEQPHEETYPLPTRAGPFPVPQSAEPPAMDTGSPAFDDPPVFDEQTPLPDEGADSESAAVAPIEMPTTYVTVAEDSFWNISKRRYGGEGRFFKALYYHNRYRILRPDQIPAGIEIETPPLEQLKRLYPDLCGVGQRR